MTESVEGAYVGNVDGVRCDAFFGTGFFMMIGDAPMNRARDSRLRELVESSGPTQYLDSRRRWRQFKTLPATQKKKNFAGGSNFLGIYVRRFNTSFEVF